MLPCALGSDACFSVVNASGLSFQRTLQLVVAQGFANRDHGPSVYVVGIEWFPGMAGIEWFPGTGCHNCIGLRERWLASLSANRHAVNMSGDQLLALVHPMLAGGALYSADEVHALGPLLTACGIDNLLPATSVSALPFGLAVRFDSRRRWRNATEAAWYTARQQLPRTNQSTLALQAPTNLPFLADAIVAWRLPMLWMADMCRDPQQNAALRYAVEGSGHFDASPTVQYLGWFNNTHLPNVELLSQCTASKRLITIASDWAENLSFLSRLPLPDHAPPEPWHQPADAVTEAGGYSSHKTYVAIVVSDGDNLAQDWANLRPMLERRLALKSKVPMSWTVSNRWRDFGRPVLRWFYSAAASSGGHDSLLMGPSGYGYLFPGAIEEPTARHEFGRRTAEAASALGMQAYVHWDVDKRMDPATTQRTTDAIRMLNGSAVRGVFMIGSDPIADMVGDVVVINKPALPWGWENTTAAAAVLNGLDRGTITYAYMNMKSDPKRVDELAALLQPHVRLLGHRELIRVARLAREKVR